MKGQLSYITLTVTDLQRQLRFYRDGFQFPIRRQFQDPEGAERDFVFFDLGELTLALYPRRTLAKDAAIAAAGQGFSGVGLSFNVESRIEVDELMARLKSYGATITRPARKEPWGGYSGYLQDPEQNLWEIVWSPSRHPESGQQEPG